MRGVLIALMAVNLCGQSRLQFVSCPVVRDTKTQPCWLTEYKGETYFLGIQGGVVDDFYPPQLMHQVLVEGVVGDGARVCGGIPLRPVKISVLPELAPACNTMLPAEEGLEAPARVRAAGGPYSAPAPSWVKVEGPAATTVYFDFDNDFLSTHATHALGEAAKYAKEKTASSIEVTGYRASTLLSGGETITEKTGLTELRARKVAEILVGLGVARESIIVNTLKEAVKADGVADAWNRRVSVVVK